MACTTTCPTCGRCYEERSEDEANSLSRQCQRCHEEAARTTPMRPLEIIDYMTPLPSFPRDAISMDSPPIRRTMKTLRELAESARLAGFVSRWERAALVVNNIPQPPSRTPLLDELNLPPELLNQLLRAASPEMLEHLIRQYHQPLSGESLKAALDYLNSLQEDDDVTNTERTMKTIGRNGARCDETPMLNDIDEHQVAQLEGIRLALCEIALNTAAIADHLAGRGK